jgi:uncharacterized protein (TIGR03000 family)
MLHRSTLLLAVAVSGLLVATETANAQRGRGGRGGVSIGIGTGGYGGYYGGGYYDGYRGYNNYYSPGISVGIGPVRIGTGYGGYGGYRSSSYYYPSGNSYYYSSPSVTYSQPSIVQGSSEEAESFTRGDTRVQVILPDPNAEVWFDGFRSEAIGEVRSYGFPDDRQGETRTHKFTAKFMRDGRMVTETREVKVTGGTSATVDFTKPGKNLPETPRDPISSHNAILCSRQSPRRLRFF